jgi:hypothetical protein
MECHESRRLTDRCLPQLVEEQVTNTGGDCRRVAGSQLTYAELNLRANQIGTGCVPWVGWMSPAVLMEWSLTFRFACLEL